MGGRGLRRLGIAILTLIVLLLVADRVGVVIAEHTAGDTIKSSQHLKSRPDVDIAGFPFLTQLATGHYDKITITAKHVPLSRAANFLDISRIRVVLHSLSVSRDFSDFHAKTATASALISYPDLSKALDVSVSYAGSGRVKIEKSLDVAGHSVGGAVQIRPQLVNGALTFAGRSVVSLPLQGIPFDIRVQSLGAAKDGLVLGLAGSNLVYHS